MSRVNLNVIVGESESKMRNSVETVNAAATAIVTAESRVQPSSVQVFFNSFIDFLSSKCVSQIVIPRSVAF